MPKKPSKRRRIEREHQAVYDSVVFQAARVMSGPDDMGFMELSTNAETFVVLINHNNAEYLIDQLQDFLKGRAPHFARDHN